MSTVVCPACGSANIIKKGTSSNGGERKLCKNCGKHFVIHNNSSSSSTTHSSTPSVNQEMLNARRAHNIADNTTVNNTAEEVVIDFSDNNIDLILARAKKDENNNFLLRIGNNAPVPIGSSSAELRRIVESNGNCKLSMSSNGILVLTVNTTTKG